MPRIRRTTESVVARERPVIERRTITLRSTPRDAPAATTAADLRSVMFSQRPPEQDLYRTRYGRALNLDRIEYALTSADWGNMRALTDLSRETIDTDPHLAAVLNKRFGSIAALPVEVIPAQGIGIDKGKARFYAEVVNDQFKQLPNFSQRVHQLAWGLFDGRAALEIAWSLLPMLPGMPTPSSAYGTVRWLARDLGWIHPRRIHFGPERELRVYDEMAAGNFAEVGVALNDFPNKFIQFSPQLFGDYPEREGLSRRCLYWSFFKRFGARERQVLMELYGKPWRWLEVDEDSSADKDDLASADEQMQHLGGQVSFRFPRGTKFQVTQPGKGAGEVHQAVIEESDKQVSKLVLGQTGTTDPNPAGLNSNQAAVMQDEQLMILMRDATQISEVLETGLSDPIIELNFGPAELPHAPHIRLRSDVPLDRNKELERLSKAVHAGIEVPVTEAYELSGFRAPKEDEAVIKMETPPLHPFAIQPPPERPLIVHPRGAALPERQVQPIAPVGDGGLPSPEDRPPGTPVAPTTPPGAGAPPQPPSLPGETSPPPPATATKVTAPFAGYENFDACVADQRSKGHSDEAARQICGALQRDIKGDRWLQQAHEADLAVVLNTRAAASGLVCPCCGDSVKLQAGDLFPEDDLVTDEVRKARQPETVNGSVETIVEKGTKEGSRVTGIMSVEYSRAVTGLEDAAAINEALDRAAEDMNLHPLTRALERRIIHGALLGAADSFYETQTGDVVEPASFAVANDPKFAEKALAKALAWFKARNIVTRTTFDRLDAAAKRRAFTIAGVTNAEMLSRAKDELEKTVRTGKQLRNFNKFVGERMESAGFTPSNPSHVETIYRTNVLNAHGSGKHAHMTQPEVLRARPFWQFRTVNDGPPRQRRTHQAVHLKVLRADDPGWQRFYPPMGFNCRCRVVSMSQQDVDDRGIKITSGASITGLPDRGFTAGTPTLL